MAGREGGTEGLECYTARAEGVCQLVVKEIAAIATRPRGSRANSSWPGSEAIRRKDGSRLILEPTETASLLEWLAAIEPWSEEFPGTDDPPPEPVEL